MALLLTTKNQVLACKQISVGSINSSWAGVREVYHEAVQHLAASVILAHNHPSGDPAPSMEDVNVTRKMIRGGELMDIRLLDHIIIGRQGNYSFYVQRPELWA